MSSAARGEHISAILIIIEEYHVRKPFGGSCGSRQWCRVQRRRKLGTRGAITLPDFADIEERTGAEIYKLQTIISAPLPQIFEPSTDSVAQGLLAQNHSFFLISICMFRLSIDFSLLSTSFMTSLFLGSTCKQISKFLVIHIERNLLCKKIYHL